MAPKQTACLQRPALLILRSCDRSTVEDQHCLRQRQISETCMPGFPLRASQLETSELSLTLEFITPEV